MHLLRTLITNWHFKNCTFRLQIRIFWIFFLYMRFFFNTISLIFGQDLMWNITRALCNDMQIHKYIWIIAQTAYRVTQWRKSTPAIYIPETKSTFLLWHKCWQYAENGASAEAFVACHVFAQISIGCTSPILSLFCYLFNPFFCDGVTVFHFTPGFQAHVYSLHALKKLYCFAH